MSHRWMACNRLTMRGCNSIPGGLLIWFLFKQLMSPHTQSPFCWLLFTEMSPKLFSGSHFYTYFEFVVTLLQCIRLLFPTLDHEDRNCDQLYRVWGALASEHLSQISHKENAALVIRFCQGARVLSYYAAREERTFSLLANLISTFYRAPAFFWHLNRCYVFALWSPPTKSNQYESSVHSLQALPISLWTIHHNRGSTYCSCCAWVLRYCRVSRQL